MCRPVSSSTSILLDSDSSCRNIKLFRNYFVTFIFKFTLTPTCLEIVAVIKFTFRSLENVFFCNASLIAPPPLQLSYLSKNPVS